MDVRWLVKWKECRPNNSLCNKMESCSYNYAIETNTATTTAVSNTSRPYFFLIFRKFLIEKFEPL